MVKYFLRPSTSSYAQKDIISTLNVRVLSDGCIAYLPPPIYGGYSTVYKVDLSVAKESYMSLILLKRLLF